MTIDGSNFVKPVESRLETKLLIRSVDGGNKISGRLYSKELRMMVESCICLIRQKTT